MATNTAVMKQNNGAVGQQRMGIAGFLATPPVRANVVQVVGEKNATRFISSVVSAVQTNPALAECTNKSILSAALLGEALNLSPSPQLGQFYMVPFNNKKAGTTEAQFQMGYKGYIQLAIRSGQYRRINVIAIKEGELKYFDPLNEEIQIDLMIDKWDEREEKPTIGYYAMFELVNGFRKAIYWSKSQMLHHADKYSQAFSKDAKKKRVKNEWKQLVSFEDYEAGKYQKEDEWLYSSFWYKNFDGMAYKTMLRQLISKWGIMSIELEMAFKGDMAVLDENGNPQYVDNPNTNIAQQVAEEIESTANTEEFTIAEPAQIEEKPAQPTVSEMTKAPEKEPVTAKGSKKEERPLPDFMNGGM